MDRKSKYNREYFERDIPETQFRKRALLRPDQHMALCYALGFDKDKKLKRQINKVLSIGCGVGDLEQELTYYADVTGIDIADNTHLEDRVRTFKFIEGGMEAIPEEDFDVVIFCESIEHIPKEEFDIYWPRLTNILHKTKGLLIIVNWEDYHPIHPDGSGYDHVRLVDDAFYDYLSAFGEKVVVRKGSHLVIQF